MSDKDLSNGPAKLCEAFDIARNQNGVDLLGDELYVTWEDAGLPPPIGRSARIGIGVATEKLWRFYIKGNRWVSRPPKVRSRR